MNKIIAIVGMCGAGKSIASDYLESLGYQKVYFGGVTMEKLKADNLEITPDNEKMMRESLRKNLGMGAFAIILLPKIKEYAKNGDVVLDGLYSWDELNILKNEFHNDLKLIAVITDKSIRYDRLSKRPIRPFSKEEATKRDVSEIENIAKAGPIAYADYFIFNNGNIEEHKKRLKEILEDIKRGE